MATFTSLNLTGTGKRSAEIRTELYPRHGCCGLRPPRLEEPVQDYGSLPVEIALASLLPFPPVRTCYNPLLHLDLPTLRVGLLKAPFLRFADALWSPASVARRSCSLSRPHKEQSLSYLFTAAQPHLSSSTKREDCVSRVVSEELLSQHLQAWLR